MPDPRAAAPAAGGRPTPRQVTLLASLLLAPNPSPMTLDGTNTWILRAPGATGCVVVDPGPPDPGHLAAIVAAGPVDVILLTHGHIDHSEGAAPLHELTSAPVRALDVAHRLGDEGLTEGDVIAAAGVEIRVLATPGHSSDSLSFVLTDDRRADTDSTDSHNISAPTAGSSVLTGDTILGRGTTVVAHPDGQLGDYLTSLRRLRELGDCVVLPGHGPHLPAAGRAAEAYLAHREARLDQVRAALAAGDSTVRQIVQRIYTDVDRALWPAAEMSVRAQIEHLHQRRELRTTPIELLLA
ncbi:MULTISPECIES: MBL fold metallo-hydrolase [Protofrankia]|uniref:MBL fold metallo-hydrolase n=1 Tax=Protofrankia TaxID=2994361 RepID=UPI0006407E67|nr:MULTISPECIES: MBL fold metallo-hydrolase [Protofrankia]ONH37812.1 MBL fold metallo-hydrolase [Protofrankia sp. BMG5.30]